MIVENPPTSALLMPRWGVHLAKFCMLWQQGGRGYPVIDTVKLTRVQWTKSIR